MAVKNIQIRIDDTDDKDIPEGEDVGTTYIGVNGAWLAIDLRKSNFEAFEKAIKPWTSKARKLKPEEVAALGRVKSVTAKLSSDGKNTGGSGLSKAERTELRAWAEGKGWGNRLPDRGRIPLDIVEEYQKAKAAGEV